MNTCSVPAGLHCMLLMQHNLASYFHGVLLAAYKLIQDHEPFSMPVQPARALLPYGGGSVLCSVSPVSPTHCCWLFAGSSHTALCLVCVHQPRLWTHEEMPARHKVLGRACSSLRCGRAFGHLLARVDAGRLAVFLHAL